MFNSLRRTAFLFSILSALLLSDQRFAQEKPALADQDKPAEDLAKAAQNPVAS